MIAAADWWARIGVLLALLALAFDWLKHSRRVRVVVQRLERRRLASLGLGKRVLRLRREFLRPAGYDPASGSTKTTVGVVEMVVINVGHVPVTITDVSIVAYRGSIRKRDVLQSDIDRSSSKENRLEPTDRTERALTVSGLARRYVRAGTGDQPCWLRAVVTDSTMRSYRSRRISFVPSEWDIEEKAEHEVLEEILKREKRD